MKTKDGGVESFYHRINRSILIVKDYTEIRYLDKLLQMLRLKPYDFIFSTEKKLQLRRYWIDEQGNSLFITEDKKIEISICDLSIDRNKLVGTDLYSGLSVNKIYSISKMVFIFTARDEEQHDHFIVALLGIDNFLRLFVFTSGEWKVCPELCLGQNLLKNISRNTKIRRFKPLRLKETIIRPCTSERAWLTCIPIPDELKRELPDNLLKYLNGDSSENMCEM